ncbi:PAS domain S-box-containing protein/diguanylate cyclase (GGDEF) domain-containing protein [Jatrophihabitans endophyticus]|uniref:PAS domain S-box-containing protein/diguanylate cyclase (GGDEF) domain-containing protein n=1 Tax=Jatrophihabitans endophyticus TaxID=1206085 RepID=A0A1M5DRX4_9ACTN|nr:PAS domain S-box protein [Jatrophihabitans endophyticus]SHF69710.1 PAS domain S-box-containing protein/diguanylate cyclase (GGDEF) domain-containing protein [Jatrophihabitans endophyticus]
MHAMDRLAAVVALQSAVAEVPAGDLDRLLQLVADHSLAAFPRARGAVVATTADGRLHAHAVAGSSATVAGAAIDESGSLTGRAMAERTTLLSRDTASDPRIDRAIATAADMASAVAAPLVAGDRVVGAVTLSSDLVNAFGRADADQLCLFAQALGGVLRHWSDSARNAELLADTRRALAVVEESEARFRATFDGSPLGMAVIRADAEQGWPVVRVNPAMSTLFGHPATTLLGMSLDGLIGVPASSDVPSSGLYDLVVHHRPVTLERLFRRADGRQVWTTWRVVPMTNGPDDELHLLAQITDVTARRRAEQRARRQARLLDLIPEPVIVRSLDGTIRFWNDGAVATYGFRAQDAIGRRTHDLLHTEFVGVTLPELEDRLASAGSWRGQLEHRHADGRTLRMTSQHVLDSHGDGEPVILEINVDVTERVEAERALAASEAKFRSQFRHSTVGQLIRRVDGTIEDVNPALARMLGYRAEELVGASVDLLLAPAIAELRRATLTRLLNGEDDATTTEGVLVRKDGSLLDVEANMSVARGPDGSVQQVIGIYQDITARKIAEDTLHHRALHDSLTGLANRALLGERLSRALGEAPGSGRTVGLLFLDLDGFKAVNDGFGHDTGDALLVEVARRLDGVVRAGDTVARLGGDEFVVLCPDLEAPEQLHIVAQRALDRVAAPYVVGGACITTVSASIGMSLPGHATDPHQALADADRAMYQVKKSGKNRIGMLAEPAPAPGGAGQRLSA